MAIINRRPGRWVRACPTDDVDYCALLTDDDWEPRPWIISGECTLTGVFMLPNTVDGLIATVDSYPPMTLYDNSGTVLDTLTYNSGLGYYVPQVEACVQSDYYVKVVGIEVTLTTGDECTNAEFSQFFGNIGEPAALPAIQYDHNLQTGHSVTIEGGQGVVIWDDGDIDAFDASGGAAVLSHNYGSPGTYTVQIICNATDITRFDARNQGLVNTINVSQCSNLTNLDVGDNTGLTGITAPISSVTYTNFQVDNTGITSLSIGNLNGLGGNFEADDCTSMVSASFGSSSVAFSMFLFFDNTAFVGTLDLVNLTGWGGNINISGNTNMTGLNAPTSSETISFLLANDNDFTGSINLSGLTGLGGSVDLFNNPNATNFVFPTSSTEFDRLLAYDNTGWNTTADLSGLSGLGSVFDIHNTGITGFSPPTSSQTFAQFSLYSNSSLNINLDLSTLTGLGGGVALQSNGLTGLTLPTSAVTTNAMNLFSNSLGFVSMPGMTFSSSVSIRMENNAMTTAEVNEQLVHWDSIFGAGTGSLRIDGTNGAPDGSSGGFDGTTAKNNLIANGWTVTTN